MSYTGTIATSSFPGITAGENYAISLVFDNGGTSSASQTWTRAQVRCIVWHLNNAKSEVISFDFSGVHTMSGTGDISTNASGALTSVPGDFIGDMLAPHTGLVVSTGSTNFAVGRVDWRVRDSGAGDTTFLEDTTPRTLTADMGYITNRDSWTRPTAVAEDTCATLASTLPVAASAAPTSTAAIPVLGAPGLVLLGTLTGLLGWRRLGRRTRQAA